MPMTIADGRTRVTVLTEKPADPRNITVTELESGVDISCQVLKSDYRISPTGSDTVDDAPLCSSGNAVTFGASNYEGTVTVIRFLDEDGLPDPAEDEVWDLLATKGTLVWFVEREGPRYDVPWTAGDPYDAFHVMTDDPQKPSDRGGYIKRVIPLGVQNAVLNREVAAGSGG